jgi:glycosyltransferase involved in cell wall biosynthesis
MSEARTAPAARRVCFITTEFHGLFKNGGIGTANTGLALALAAAGFDVTVAFANADATGPRTKTGNFAELKAHYRSRGITLDFVPPHPLIPAAFNDPRSASYSVFLYVQRGAFDVVLFNDNGGQGYFSLLAKHTGVLANPPMMCVVAHGPLEWVLELNASECWSRELVIIAYMERRSVQLADVLVSPSRYLIDWMVEHGWAMPQRTSVIQNVVGGAERIGAAWADWRGQGVTELVLFGRQEVRKGLELFCDALDLLHRTTDLAAVTVTFLGKFSHVAGLHSGIYVVERARRWRAPLRLVTVYDQGEALDYLSRPGVLAVIPSLAENSPCVVAECLQFGLPFLATDSGGTAELVAPEDRHTCLFAPNAAALAARLGDVLRTGHRPARLAATPDATVAAWLRLLAPPATRTAVRSRPPAKQPLVSVCLVHNAAAPCSAPTLESVMRQTYPRMEIVVAWDGRAAALAGADPAGAVPVRVVETADHGRDAAARQARGDYLLFIDEAAVTLLADCVDALVTACERTGADILTGFASISADGGGASPTFPIGACVELGAVENCFGEGLVFVASRAWQRGAGYAGGCDEAVRDWLFLATSVVGGCTLEVVPKPLFYRRIVPRPRFDAGRTISNRRRIMQAYRDLPLSTFRRIVESMLQIAWPDRDALDQGLQQVGASARAIALRMASMEPNSAEANRAFIAYCCARHFIPVALDFGLLNDVALLPDAVGAARQATETAALDALQWRRLDFRHDLDLTEELRRRVRPVAPLRAADLVRSADTAVAHPLGLDIGIVKAAGVCPPGTGRVRAGVTIMPADRSAVQVAVAVCGAGSRLTVSDTLQIAGDGGAWSGWVAAAGEDGDGAEVVVTLAEPTGDVLDLYLLSRREDGGPCPQTTVVWRRVIAEISVNGAISPSTIERETVLLPVPAEVIRRGELLTDVSGFPFPVFVPGERTMLHPVPGKTALVRLAGALPAGAHGLRAVVSAGHAKAHPIDFAVWIRPSRPEALDESGLSEAEGFSGWFTVPEALVCHQLTVTLPAPADDAMDVYLATRVTGSADVHFCHAYWHELWTMERS